ncbi:hypothetical protein PVAP13_8KG314228 [Panicum virgatum]|uniref:Uncharacterized protein n=1 Tax=Panicum virgatum TaxID=38727 RepID=A0A8T0PWI2_PANVG|nr:hypothetical protein PVAP13_8KG314228 [Panicum virgatum]
MYCLVNIQLYECMFVLCPRRCPCLSSFEIPFLSSIEWLFMRAYTHAFHSLHHACQSYSDAYCRYVIQNQVCGASSSNGGPEDPLSPKHDLEGPSVVFGRRSCPRDQGVAWGKASQPGKITIA